MIKSWSDAAWEDFEYWMKQDKRTLKRIVYRIEDNMVKIVQCGSHYRDK